mgnify:CR=1 FL=1
MLSVTVAGVAFANTRAVWTDNVTVLNNTITTGTVDLKVDAQDNGTWSTSSEASSMVLSNLVPGNSATGAYSFSLLNDSTGITTMNLVAQITSSLIAPTAGVDKTQLMIRLYDYNTGTPESAEASLSTWEAGTQALTSSLATSASRRYEIRARLLGTALNEWQGQTVTFTLSVTGSQP